LQSQIPNDSLTIDTNPIVKDTVNVDSIPKKEPTLLDKVRYKAKEYVRINRKENKLYLYDEAELYYQDMELKAGIIVLDASRIPQEYSFKPLTLSKLIMKSTPILCVSILTPKKH
jgi:hypothetical protein